MSDQKIAATHSARTAALKIGSAEESASQKRANLSRSEEKKSSFARHMEARQEATGAVSEQREQLGQKERLQGEQERQGELSRDGSQRMEQRTERHAREVQQQGESQSARHREEGAGDVSSRDSAMGDKLAPHSHTTRGQADAPAPPSTSSQGATAQDQELAPVKEVEASAEGVGSSVMEQVQQVEKMEDLHRVQQIARELVEACQLGEGAMAKRVMLLEVSMPGGEGSVKVRLRRDGDGIEVRLRGSDAQTTSLLRKHQQSLRDEGARRGVVFKKIEIV